jgi:integrase
MSTWKLGTLTVTGTFDRKVRQRTDPKTDKSRRAVPLTTQAMEAHQLHQVRQNLEGTQGSDDLVFTSTRGTALYESNIRKHWHRVSANLGTTLDAVA